MNHHPLLGRLKLPCLMLALFASPASVRAAYAPPTSAAALVGDLIDFVDSFTTWNASLHNEPLLLLESTPASEQGEMAVLLFMLWMEEQVSGGPTGAVSVSTGQIQTVLGDLVLPGNSSTGSANASGTGNGSSLIDLPSGSSGPDNGGSSGPNNGGNSGPSPFSNPSSNPPSGNNDPSPLGDPAPVPEPSSLALLGTGAIGFLMFGMGRGRKRSQLRSETPHLPSPGY